MENTKHLTSLAPAVTSLTDLQEQLYQEYTDKMKRIESAAALLQDGQGVTNGYITAQNDTTMKKHRKPNKRSNRETFGSVIEKILGNGKPLTSSDLRTEYNKIHSNKFDAKNFSARLSNLNGKENSQIARTKIGTKSYYGLVGWFSGKKLKPEYLHLISQDKGSHETNNQRAQMNN